MAKGIYINDNNEWKKVKSVWLNNSGVWKKVKAPKININGNWKNCIIQEKWFHKLDVSNIMPVVPYGSNTATNGSYYKYGVFETYKGSKSGWAYFDVEVDFSDFYNLDIDVQWWPSSDAETAILTSTQLGYTTDGNNFVELKELSDLPNKGSWKKYTLDISNWNFKGKLAIKFIWNSTGNYRISTWRNIRAYT